MSVMLYPCMFCVALLMDLFVLCVACLTVFVNCLVKQFNMFGCDCYFVVECYGHHTQHRPICVPADPVIVAHPTLFRRRFNLRKADWNGYSAALDKLIEDVEPIPEKYGGFLEDVRVASRIYIPRG